MLDPPEVTPYDLRCASVKVNCWLKELTSKQAADGSSETVKKCLPTQFILAVDTTESDADSALSIELDSVKQDIAVQKAVVDAHVRLLREAKVARQPRHVRKQRAADYQTALEKLSQLNLKARSIRDRMSNAELYDDDTISQASSFAFCNGFDGSGYGVGSGGVDVASLASSSSAYHSSPRNPGTDYYSESLLSGQMYDARSLVSDLSRESSVRSAVSANASILLGQTSVSQQSARRPVETTDPADPAGPSSQSKPQQQPPPIVPRRSGLGANARAGSKWRRSNSMGNLLADQQQQLPQHEPQHQPQYQPQPQPRRHLPVPAGAPINTSFPKEMPPPQTAPYRRTSDADRGPSLSYRYQPRPSLDFEVSRAATGQTSAAAPQLTASHQSPYWYTPRARLEPAAPLAVARHRKQYSDL